MAERMTFGRIWGDDRVRDGVAAALLSVLVLGPALVLPGNVLVGDMVFVPNQPWKSTWLGADGSVPRAVPSDAVVSLLDVVLPGSLVQKLLLGLTFFLAGFGIARLVADRSGVARLAAMVLFVWNPFVHARLAIGHWALLVGYAALPWVVRAARDLRSGTGHWSALALPLLAAGWASPTGGLLALAVALLCLAPTPRQLPVALGTGLLANVPWILPGILNPSARSADDFGVEAFAARADTPWGVPGSLLGLGGMWKSSVDAPGRDSLLLSGVGLVVVLAGLVGLWALRRRDRTTAYALAVGAVAGFVVALASSTEAGRQASEWFVTTVPGGGLVRDAQKYVALVALAAAVGLAHGFDWLRARVAQAGTVPMAALALLPILVLPGLGWGLLGTLTPSQFPAEWEQARRVMEARGAAHERTVVLPFSLYRRFDWNADKAVLDPAPRFFPGEVVIDDALVVDTGVVSGEDPMAARVRAASDSPAALERVLAEEGVGWVIVHEPDSGRARMPRGEIVLSSDELTLIRLEGRAPARSASWDARVVTGSAVSALFALVTLGLSSTRAIGAYTHRRENQQSRGGHG